MIRMDRVKLLSSLRQLLPGITRADTFAQSSCIAFTQGMAISMQERVSCSMPSPFNDEVNGAVPAKKLFDVLTGFKQEEVRVSQDNGHLLIQPGEKKKGEKEAARIDMEAEIEMPVYLLPHDAWEDWQPLDGGFGDAVKLVSAAGKAKKAADKTYTQMIRLAEKWVEAIDNVQCARWPLPLGLDCVCLTEDLEGVAWLGVREVAENERWISFRSPSGLIYSCRKEDGSEYPDLAPIFDVQGIKVVLPKGLVDSAKLGEVFSKRDDTHNDLLFTFSEGTLTICGFGPQGEYTKQVEVEYVGPDTEFYMNAGRFCELADRHSECVLSPNRMRVQTPDYVWVSVLVPKEDKM